MSVISHGVEIVANTLERPASPSAGTLIYQSDTNQLLLWNGSTWVSPMTNQTAGGALSGTYPNPSIASISGISAGGGLSGTYPNPSIASPMLANHFHVTAGAATYPTGTSQAAGVTLNIPFRANLHVLQQQTGYASGAGLYTQYGAINGITGWNGISRFYHNTTFDHRTYPMGCYSATVNAGNYYFMGYSGGSLTDVNDWLTVVVFCRAVA